MKFFWPASSAEREYTIINNSFCFFCFSFVVARFSFRSSFSVLSNFESSYNFNQPSLCSGFVFGQDSEQVLFSNRILNQPCTCTETWVGPVLCRIQNKLRLLLDFEPALFLYRILTTGSAQFLGRIRKPPWFFAGFWTNPDSVLDSEPALILC